MRHKSSTPETPSSQSPSERLVRDIRRATRKRYSAEEKIRIVLDGPRGEVTIAELCRREGFAGMDAEFSGGFLHGLVKAS
jgi:transposase